MVARRTLPSSSPDCSGAICWSVSCWVSSSDRTSARSKLGLATLRRRFCDYTRCHVHTQVEGVHKTNECTGAISDRKAGIALDDLLAQHRPLARFPERCRVDDPVAQRTAIGTIAARDRAWNADELGPHLIAREPHRRIAVTTQVNEF